MCESCVALFEPPTVVKFARIGLGIPTSHPVLGLDRTQSRLPFVRAACARSICATAASSYSPSHERPRRLHSSLIRSQAQYALGFMYDTGRGVAKDEFDGLRWIRSAAEKGEVYGVGIPGLR